MALSRRDFIARSALVFGAGTLGSSSLVRAMQQAGMPPPAGAAPTPAQWQPVFTPVRRNVGYFTGRGGTIGYLIDKGLIPLPQAQRTSMAASARAFTVMSERPK